MKRIGKSLRTEATEAATKVLVDQGIDETEAAIFAGKITADLAKKNLLCQKEQQVTVSEDGVVTFPVNGSTHRIPIGRLEPLIRDYT